MESIIRSNIYGDNEDAFFVFNVEDMIRKHEKWLELMPRVVAHYAVKCNNNPLVLEILAGLGLGFDCSSQAEVESVLNSGTDPKNIIFANSYKPKSFIRYIQSVGVDVTTFDNEEELVKISAHFPKARLVLRIKADNGLSISKSGLKFGADVQSFEYLLKRAKELNMNVIGAAFHVGSGYQSTSPFSVALRDAKKAFDIGIGLGFKMSLLDIGGAFPGSDQNSKVSFEVIANSVNKDLDKYFPKSEKELTIIGEPGRYYAMSAFDLMTSIISKTTVDVNNEKLCMYYINDGYYGSFSSVLTGTGNKQPEPIPLLKNEDELKSRSLCSAVIWGPTCDVNDCVRRDLKMPELKVGEWIRFKNMGAYSISASSHFNGMSLPKIKLYISDYAKDILINMKNWHRIDALIKQYKD